MHASLKKLILLTGASLLLSLCACSSTPAEKREPANADEVVSPSSQDYGAETMSASATTVSRRVHGVSAPHLVTDSSARRQKRREKYQKQQDSWFGNVVDGAAARSSGASCGGVAYQRLASTISSCGCQIVSACGQSHRAPTRKVPDSCHNYGKAVDVTAVRCDGAKATPGTARFNQFVKCEEAFFKKTLWHTDSDHYTNAHFSFCCPESRINPHMC